MDSICLLVIIIVVVIFWFYCKSDNNQKAEASRQLWRDHVEFTREWMLLYLANSPAAEVTANRLMANQDDLAKFYGIPELAPLLKDHINIAVKIVQDTNTNSKHQTPQGQLDLWYKNAMDISNLIKQKTGKDISDMMKMHLDLTLKEAAAGITGNWQGSIMVYNDIVQEALKMSDMLS